MNHSTRAAVKKEINIKNLRKLKKIINIKSRSDTNMEINVQVNNYFALTNLLTFCVSYLH